MPQLRAFPAAGSTGDLGDQPSRIGKAGLATEQCRLVAFVFERHEPVIARLDHASEDLGNRQIAEAEDRAADMLAAQRFQPTGARLGWPDVEILQVDEAGMPDRRARRHQRVFVDAHEIADIERHLEARRMNGVDQALDALAGVHQEPVILDAGDHTETLGVRGDLPARIDDDGKGLLEFRGFGGPQRPWHDIVAEKSHVEPVAELDVALDALDLGAARVGVDEVGADADAGDRNAGFSDRRLETIEHFVVGAEVVLHVFPDRGDRERRQFEVLAAIVPDPREHVFDAHRTVEHQGAETVGTQADFHKKLLAVNGASIENTSHAVNIEIDNHGDTSLFIIKDMKPMESCRNVR